MDIICGKCGKHFSSVEAAKEHKCPIEEPHLNRSMGRTIHPSTRHPPYDADRIENPSKYGDSLNGKNNGGLKPPGNSSFALGCFIILLLIGGLIFGGIKLYDANRENIKLGVEGVAQIGNNTSLAIQKAISSSSSNIDKTITKATPAIKEAVKQVFTIDTSVETYSQMFNDYRQQNGRSPLIFTDDLNRIASLRLKELYTNYSHYSAGGYNRHLAENICMISSGSLSNVAAFTSWKGSLLHNANMLNPSYKYTGYAAGGGYAVQVFTEWTTINGEPILPPGYIW